MLIAENDLLHAVEVRRLLHGLCQEEQGHERHADAGRRDQRIQGAL